jgi:rhamnose transport system ATP-binding protein
MPIPGNLHEMSERGKICEVILYPIPSIFSSCGCLCATAQCGLPIGRIFVSTPKPVLTASGIDKSFGGIFALQDVRFELLPGEVHALLGENGAGKSTLIKIITGVHQPDAGEIRLDGQAVHFGTPRDSRDAGIAAIYQEPSLFPELDIAENIYVGRQPTQRGSVAWKQMYRDAQGVLDVLGIKLDPRTKARHLSVAQQQGVEIARALSINAKILIMDEPSSSLTLAEVDDLFRIVRTLRDQGTAIIFISHRLEELFQIADRVTVLRDGHYVDSKPMAGVTTEELIQMMVGRTLADLFPKLDVTPGEALLQVEGLTKAGKFHDISFTVHAGEIVGLAGLVGAGRTDVACAIFGVEPATSGTIRVDGQPAAITSPQQALALGIAYVPEDRQHHGLVLPMSISSNITLPILKRFVKRVFINEREESAASIDAAEKLEVKCSGTWQKARELSGGNQQKVVLAKWLETEPRILILDEPTRGIDVGTKAAVHALMSELASQGLAILMISSELPEVLGMSDRILVMREGRLVAEISRAEATQAMVMLAATTGSPVGAPDSAELVAEVAEEMTL